MPTLPPHPHLTGTVKSSTGHRILRGLLNSDKDQSCFITEKGDMIFSLSNNTEKCRTKKRIGPFIRGKIRRVLQKTRLK